MDVNSKANLILHFIAFELKASVFRLKSVVQRNGVTKQFEVGPYCLKRY